MQLPATRLYVITPEQFTLEGFLPQLEEAFAGGDIASLQLRLKNTSAQEVERYARALLPLCHAHECAFILNDYPEVAATVGADGLHLGEDDMPLAQARRIIGPNMILGSSCYASKDRAFEAGEQDADYVAFGAFFDTQTKAPRGRPTPDILSWWHEVSILPCVAIGGIKAHNLAPLVQAGADFIAVVTAVWNHPQGPRRAVEELNQAIATATT